MDSKISLLEKLTKLTGAMYLSDLKTMAYATIRTELHDIDPKKIYSVSVEGCSKVFNW